MVTRGLVRVLENETGFTSLVAKKKAKLDCSVSSNEERVGEERGNEGERERENLLPKLGRLSFEDLGAV